MTVKEMITELLNYDMDETVSVQLEETEEVEKVSTKLSIKSWHGEPTIHFVDWRKRDGE